MAKTPPSKLDTICKCGHPRFWHQNSTQWCWGPREVGCACKVFELAEEEERL